MENIGVYLMGGIILFIFVWLFLAACRWCTHDATIRDKSPLAVTIAVIFFFPYGLIAWLVFRPEINTKMNRQLERFR